LILICILPAHLLVQAEDDQQQVVAVSTSFNLEEAVVDEDLIVYSSDGQAELFIPANNLSNSGVVAIEPGQVTAELPENLYLMSGPYTVQTSEGLMLTGSATLSLRYLDAATGARMDTAQIYLWTGAEWLPLDTTIGEDHHIASATITTFGTYALLAEMGESVNLYLPLIMNGNNPPAGTELPVTDLADSGDETLLLAAGDITPINQFTTTYTATTDENGNYTISGLPAGTYEVSPVAGEGVFNPAMRTVTLPPSQITRTSPASVLGEMVYVPAGEFQMGCHPDHNGGFSCYSDELPCTPFTWMLITSIKPR
jgi:hypothetical protein